MRRTLLLLATMALAVLLASGVALAATFRGTDGNDTIVGTEESDQIFGRGGNDILGGGKGDDVIHGGPGIDRGQDAGSGGLHSTGRPTSNGSGGGLGDDVIHLGPGDDGTYPGSKEGFEDDEACPSNGRAGGRCEFEGGPGEDVMFGEEGDDEMNGDSLITDGIFDFPDPRGGSDTIHGGDGRDTINGNVGADKVFGGDGNDEIFGSSGDDKIYGDDGNDYLEGQEGSNTLYGGNGKDTLGISRASSLEREVWYGGAGDDYLGATDFGFPILASDSRILSGGEGDDTFDLPPGRKGDRFYGGNGNDDFYVAPVEGSGKQRIYCGTGYDTVKYDGQRQDYVTHDCEKVTVRRD